MKKFLLPFLILMTLFNFCSLETISQTKYPCIKFLSGDSVVLISKPQMKEINQMFNQRNWLKDDNFNLNQQIEQLNFIVDDYKMSTAKLLENDSIKNKIIDQKDMIIHNQYKMVDIKDSEIKYFKHQRNIVVISSVIIITLILIL